AVRGADVEVVAYRVAEVPDAAEPARVEPLDHGGAEAVHVADGHAVGVEEVLLVLDVVEDLGEIAGELGIGPAAAVARVGDRAAARLGGDATRGGSGGRAGG